MARPDSRAYEPWQDVNASPLVRIEGVTKTFGDTYAVDNVSVDIYRGEFFSLLGSSGCGKTTLLRMLAGFEQPTAGRIFIDGTDITHVPPYERPVNMMFQSYALFPHMNVERNIAFGLRQEKLPKGEIQERVNDALQLVKMTEYARRRPEQLSGGQRQRVALARALVKRPKILLLDEPLGALDKKLREHTQFELVNIQEKLGITFIMVTHDQEEAMTMSTRMAVMNDGVIVQLGTPAYIYEYPATRFIAEFVGAANVIEGRVLAVQEDCLSIYSDAYDCELLIQHHKPMDIGAPVAVALRPEKVHMVEAPAAAPAAVNTISGIVSEIAYLGDISIYHIRTTGGQLLQAQLTNRNRGENPGPTWDQPVQLTWHQSSGVVLDA
ncbi:ABC transporter ATP-binding protein [Pelobacter seleniigenes]|uniref:ABC transporter ATP-binding protein n=1 Tax=Pelobacter seleniigenes TaxID=407188 RepID=UPI0004A6AF3F|nr:polyamine ABC transporter ATP-binding protein [Pelobacter seleniigenes]